jgi:aspartyl-tRNA(Asn)/glutamyl-tRNA(Gln) amidotransferase subunit A
MADRPFDRPIVPEIVSLRLGRLGGYFAVASSDVRAAFERALHDLRQRGATITEKILPDTETIAQAYVHIVLPEAAASHAPYLDARSAEYTPNVRARLEGGRSVSAVEYLKARADRRALRDAVDAALADCDALVLPTLPCVAPIIGATEVAVDADTGEQRLNTRAAMLRNTQLFNMTGHPAISIPLRTPGLPVGLQLIGARERTARLLAVAAAVEEIAAPLIREARDVTW